MGYKSFLIGHKICPLILCRFSNGSASKVVYFCASFCMHLASSISCFFSISPVGRALTLTCAKRSMRFFLFVFFIFAREVLASREYKN